MEYLFWSQIVFWVSVFVYLYYLNLGVKNIEKQIDSLEKLKQRKKDA